MRTDQLFKDLLQTFFADFLALFLPEIAESIDPTSITFLGQEVFTDIPEGQQRIADLVAELQTLQGEPRVVLVHTEVQAERQDALGFRMWQYNALLRLRKGPPVISVVVVLYGNTAGLSLEHYAETLFGRAYPLLDYWQIGLRDLQAADYLHAEQPLAAALAALMQPGPEGVAALKATLLRTIGHAGLDPARIFLLVNTVQSFLPLDPAEEAALWEQLRAEGVFDMAMTEVPWGELTWADRMMLRGERTILLRQIRARFGAVPSALEERIEQADADTLAQLADQILTAASADDLLPQD
jgi:hypothetical protein